MDCRNEEVLHRQKHFKDYMEALDLLSRGKDIFDDLDAKYPAKPIKKREEKLKSKKKKEAE